MKNLTELLKNKKKALMFLVLTFIVSVITPLLPIVLITIFL